MACSFIASGLRVFDISDLAKPKETAYFVVPSTPNTENGYDGSNYAMSQPAFDVARHEVWYTDGGTGFYNLRIAPGAWPAAADVAPPAAAGKCTSVRRFVVTVRAPRGARVRSVRATVAGKVVRATRKGRVVRLVVDLHGQTRTVVQARVVVRLRGGRKLTSTRTYHPCRHRA